MVCKRTPSSRSVSLLSLLLALGPFGGGAVRAAPDVENNVQVNANRGQDGKVVQVQGQNEPRDCCYEFDENGERDPECPDSTCDYCVDEDPSNPGHARCDDEPKTQREVRIAAAPWDPGVLIAAFFDGPDAYVPSSGTVRADERIAFAVSFDGGDTWGRLQREDPALNPPTLYTDYPCHDPSDVVFDDNALHPHALFGYDVCPPGGIEDSWPNSNGGGIAWPVAGCRPARRIRARERVGFRAVVTAREQALFLCRWG